MAPAKFIKDNQLTFWFSVPSVIAFMSRMKMLKPNSFPTLRFSLFCGEALPITSAKAWQQAAPKSCVENLYGPTEATIAITHYRLNGAKSSDAFVAGTVPIGWPFDGQNCCVIDQEYRRVCTGGAGELCLSGLQVTDGYWNNPEKTAERFIRLSDLGDTVWYRTGDLVKRDQNGCLHYLGRIDNQVQIRGYRVELQEIDFVLRKASESQQAVSVAWPMKDGRAEGIVAFISTCSPGNERHILAYCKRFLPEYMIPRKVFFVDEIPMNVNGKIDRSKLVTMLQKEKNG